ncbi:hypothetical protein ABZX73_06425 [Brevibacterium casei]
MKKRVLKEEIRRLKRRLEIERGEKLLHLQYSVDLAKDFRVLHEQYEARGKTIHEMCEQFREKKKRIHAFYAPQQVNRKAENAELEFYKAEADKWFNNSLNAAVANASFTPSSDHTGILLLEAHAKLEEFYNIINDIGDIINGAGARLEGDGLG